MVVASTEGGMSVEEISKEKPEFIIRSKIEVAVVYKAFKLENLLWFRNRARTYFKSI